MSPDHQVLAPEEGDFAARLLEYIESLGIQRITPAEYDLARRPKAYCRVWRRFQYSDADRLCAEWLWLSGTREVRIEGNSHLGFHGQVHVREASLKRSARCVGVFSDRIAMRDDLRSEVESVSPPIRGIDFREVRIESWAGRGGLRVPLWEPVPRTTLPPMPAGSIERRTVRNEPLPPGSRFGLMQSPGMDDARLIYPRSLIDSIGNVDMAYTWEQHDERVYWPFIVISGRFHREIFLRNRIDVSCVPVHIIEPGPEAGPASLQ